MQRATLKASGLIALLTAGIVPLMLATPAAADTLTRIKDAGKITLGYRADARPFSYQDSSGKPAGYTVELCQAVADSVKTTLGLSALSVEWVPVTVEGSLPTVKDGKVDLLCGATTETLERRKDASFSIPIFESGIGALVRADAPVALRQVLSGQPASGPVWRGSPARILEQKTFSVVSGTTAESWLNERIAKLQIPATVGVVDSYAAGVEQVMDGRADVFFADRPILIDAVQGTGAGDLLVIDRSFTSEPIALALARNDDDFRLAVDQALSHIYGSPAFHDLYLKWFGEPSETALAFFRISALTD